MSGRTLKTNPARVNEVVERIRKDYNSTVKMEAKRRTSPQMRQGIAGNPTPLIKGSSKSSISNLLYIVKDGLFVSFKADSPKNLAIEKITRFFGEPSGIRIPDNLIKSQVLCQLS